MRARRRVGEGSCGWISWWPFGSVLGAGENVGLENQKIRTFTVVLELIALH